MVVSLGRDRRTRLRLGAAGGKGRHTGANINSLLTSRRQSPLFPFYTLDKNKAGTYKNIIATREMQMLTFIKDFAAFVTLGAFTIGALTWMDVVTRLV